jgi:hypothetical protein
MLLSSILGDSLFILNAARLRRFVLLRRVSIKMNNGVGMILTGEVQCTRGKTYFSATLSITDLTCTLLGLNHNFRLRAISCK